MLCSIQASSNSTCSVDHNNIIHALSTYCIRMMRIYYEYVTIITYATRCYYDDYDLITSSLQYHCWIITLPIPLSRYFTCNSIRESFHERWANAVNVSESSTNAGWHQEECIRLYYEPSRIENNGLHCEFVAHSCSNGTGVSYWALMQGVDSTPYI